MTADVVAVPEQVIRLRANGLVIGVWSCTPLALEELAVGRLMADGFIGCADDVVSLGTLPERHGVLDVEAEVAEAGARTGVEEREHRARHGCGLRFFLDCSPRTIARDEREGGPAARPDLDMFHPLFRSLYERAGAYRQTGGLHTAAFTDGGSLFALHEEVGRHNAVDKAIGTLVLERQPIGRLGLITTARISGEIAMKAARAGVAWIASRSIPTTLALEIARAARLPIVARAAGKDATVFAAT